MWYQYMESLQQHPLHRRLEISYILYKQLFFGPLSQNSKETDIVVPLELQDDEIIGMKRDYQHFNEKKIILLENAVLKKTLEYRKKNSKLYPGISNATMRRVNLIRLLLEVLDAKQLMIEFSRSLMVEEDEIDDEITEFELQLFNYLQPFLNIESDE